jgi:hypothetical protein
MGLIVELLPFLLAAYLLDCLVRVRRNQALFSSTSGRSFRLEGSGWRGAGISPTAESYLVASLGLRATESGVLIPPEHGGAERLVPYEQMERVSVEGDRVRLRPGIELRAPHPSVTTELAALVEQLRLEPDRRRLALIRRSLGRRCDLGALRRRRLELAPDLRTLKVLSGAAFALLFGVLPASFVPELAWRPSPFVAGGLFGLSYLAVLYASVRLLRKRGVEGRALASRILPLVLFPPAAAHAPALVAREVFLGFEPLAVAALLLDPQEFRRLEQRLRRDQAAVHATGGNGSLPEALALELVAREAGHAGVPALARPTPVDDTAVAFCPRCRDQYRAGFNRCHDCDVTLERFAA